LSCARLTAGGAALVVMLTACGRPDTSYTLYREGRFGGPARVHIATFDADDRTEYNRGNCEEVAALIRSQPGVTERVWCEPGRFRP
jgi:hypothetical protein